MSLQSDKNVIHIPWQQDGMLQAFWTKKIGIIKTSKNSFGDYSQIWKNKYSSRKFEIHRHHNLILRLCWLENFMWIWTLMSFSSLVLRYSGRLFIRRWKVFALENFKFLVQIMTNFTADEFHCWSNFKCDWSLWSWTNIAFNIKSLQMSKKGWEVKK